MGARRISRNVALTFAVALISTYGLTAAGASSSTATVKPVADAAVSAVAPTSKFGDLPVIGVARNPDTRSFLRFGLENVPTPLARATLRLFAINAGDGFDVHDVTRRDSWNERSLQWKNQPAFASAVAASSGAIAGYGWVSVDVTDLVRAGVRGGRELSIALTASGRQGVAFASGEARPVRGEYLGPQLVLTNDVTPPSVSLTQPANPFTNDTTPTLTGAAGRATGDSRTVSVLVYAGSGPVGTPLQTLTATRAGDGSFSVTPASLAEGKYTAQAVQSDADGNVGTSNAITFTVDATAPAPTLASPGVWTPTKAPALAGVAGAALGDSQSVTVELWAGPDTGGPPTQTLTPTVGAGGTYSAAPAGLVDGTYTARTTQTDAAGNRGRSAAVTFRVDTVAPSVTIATPAGGSSTRDQVVVLRGSAGTDEGDAATVTVTAAGQTLTPAVRDTGTWSVALGPLDGGTYTATARQLDAAGNAGTSATITFTVVAPPYAEAVTGDGPSGYWRLDDAPGSTVVADTTGHANGAAGAAVVFGDAGALTRGGGTAAIFPGGTGSTITLADVTPAVGGFTFETWVRTAATKGEVVAADGDPSGPGWELLVLASDDADGGGKVRFSLSDGVAKIDAFSAVAVNDNAWHHVAVVVGADRVATVWVDGVPGAPRQLPTGTVANASTLVLGASAGRAPYAGQLDEVAFYPAALSAAQVRTHAQVGRPAPPTPPAASAYAEEVLADSPVSYWRLGEGAGATVVRDATASAAVGTMFGGVMAAGGALAGDANGAQRFDGTGWISAGNILDAGTSDFTIEAWVRTTSTAKQAFLSKKDASGTYWELIQANETDNLPTDATFAGRARFTIQVDGFREDVYGPAFPINDGAWHQIVVTVSRADVTRVWVDGVGGVPRRTPAGDLSNAASFEIGRSLSRAGFVGDLDEVAFYRSALPAKRVRAHWSAGAPTPVDDPANPTLLAAGDVADCETLAGAQQTARLIDRTPGRIAVLGDNAYPVGAPGDFASCYEPTWGIAKSRTSPAPGNHEYRTPGAAGFFGYWGPRVGNPARGYYSYDLGSWHVVVLNTNGEHACEAVSCAAGSAQEQWLRADLAAHPEQCTIAYFHAPLFTSGKTDGPSPQVRPLWQALYDGGADVVLSAHEHNYERFRPQDPAGNYDPARGIVEFVAGTGGAIEYPQFEKTANSEVFNGDALGVLKLTLRNGGYDWSFLGVPGSTFTDSGSAACR